MGTKVAPTYATLVLGFLEEKLYKNLEDQFSVEFKTFIQQPWKRFLDDCFIIWTKTKDEFNKFYNILNNLNNHLKFTMDCSEQKLPFLDVMIIKKRTKFLLIYIINLRTPNNTLFMIRAIQNTLRTTYLII